MCSHLHLTQGLSKNDFIFAETVSFKKLIVINEHLLLAAFNRFLFLWSFPKYQHRQESFHKLRTVIKRCYSWSEESTSRIFGW